MSAMRRIGVLTAGGDCPGLNAVIRGVVAHATGRHDTETVGILDGWDGLMSDRTVTLDRDAVRGIIQRGGTILGTSRRDPFVHGDGSISIARTIERHSLDGIVAIGGDGTLRTALRLVADGVPIVGVPKTIDNDIAATDVTLGFDTAVQIATEAIDRITTTAESHDRVMLVEVMGRTKGWIATYAGVAAGADAILAPEEPWSLEALADAVKMRSELGRRYSVVVVAEGVIPPEGAHGTPLLDAFGFERLDGVSLAIASALEALTGIETRVTVLGHLQRGGTPTAFDRVLGSRLGVAAADLAVGGASGRMVAVHGAEIVDVPLDEACAAIRGVPSPLLDVASTLAS
jgi:phosphofructokinase-like protein